MSSYSKRLSDMVQANDYQVKNNHKWKMPHFTTNPRPKIVRMNLNTSSLKGLNPIEANSRLSSVGILSKPGVKFDSVENFIHLTQQLQTLKDMDSNIPVNLTIANVATSGNPKLFTMLGDAKVAYEKRTTDLKDNLALRREAEIDEEARLQAVEEDRLANEQLDRERRAAAVADAKATKERDDLLQAAIRARKANKIKKGLADSLERRRLAAIAKAEVEMRKAEKEDNQRKAGILLQHLEEDSFGTLSRVAKGQMINELNTNPDMKAYAEEWAAQRYNVGVSGGRLTKEHHAQANSLLGDIRGKLFEGMDTWKGDSATLDVTKRGVTEEAKSE